MIKRAKDIIHLLVMLVFSVAAPLPAQSARLSLDATAGLGISRDGDRFGDREGATFDILLSRATQQSERESRIFAVSVLFQRAWKSNVLCLESPRLDDVVGGGCESSRTFPGLFAIGAVAGIQRGDEATARFLAGPALFSSEAGNGLGFQGRMEFAGMATDRLGLLWSIRASVVKLDGNLIHLGAFAIGFRVR